MHHSHSALWDHKPITRHLVGAKKRQADAAGGCVYLTGACMSNVQMSTLLGGQCLVKKRPGGTNPYFATRPRILVHSIDQVISTIPLNFDPQISWTPIITIICIPLVSHNFQALSRLPAYSKSNLYLCARPPSELRSSALYSPHFFNVAYTIVFPPVGSPRRSGLH